MAALALNLLALLIVVGMCWMAMMWLSGRFHGHAAAPREFEFEYDTVEYVDGTKHTRRSRMDLDGSSDLSTSETPPAEPPCDVCEGVGAQTDGGKLAPCRECYGTGVLSS